MGKVKKTKKRIQARQQQKNIHAKYICGIVLSVSLVCVVLSAYNHETFVAQFSFAGTVASTILSIIAIWVSITREKGTAEIRSKINSAAGRLKKATKKAKTVNARQEENMDRQLAQLEDIQTKLSLLLDASSETEASPSSPQLKAENAAPHREPTKINNAPCQSIRQAISADPLWELFENTYGWIQGEEPNGKASLLFCKMLQTVIRCRQSQQPYTLADILPQLSLSDVQLSEWLATVHTHWGILNVLTAAGVLDDQETLKKIEEKIQKL